MKLQCVFNAHEQSVTNTTTTAFWLQKITAALHSLAGPGPNVCAFVGAALHEAGDELRDERLHVAGNAYEDVFEYVARPASHVGCGGGSELRCDGKELNDLRADE